MNMSRTQASRGGLKQNLCEYKYAPVNTWWGRVNMRRKQVNTSRHKCAPVNTSEHEWDKSKCNWWYPDNSLQPTKKTVISLSVSLSVSLCLSLCLFLSLSLSLCFLSKEGLTADYCSDFRGYSFKITKHPLPTPEQLWCHYDTVFFSPRKMTVSCNCTKF